MLCLSLAQSPPLPLLKEESIADVTPIASTAEAFGINYRRAARYMRSRAALHEHDSPEGQLLQDPGPGTFLYVPEEQAVHVPPFGPVYPSLHLHADKVSLPGDEAEPAMMPSRQLADRVAG